MADTDTAALVKKLTSDSDFRAKVNAANPEEKKRLISEAGFSPDKQQLHELNHAHTRGELDDTELAGIAGGGTVGDAPGWISVSLGAAALGA